MGYNGPQPSRIRTTDLKSRLLHLAQTSVYSVQVQLPDSVKKVENIDDINLMCTEASLPGSTLATHDVTNDYAGVTEKMAYRRIYDDSIDLTFYVDYNYGVIELFDSWIDYISGMDQVGKDEYKNINTPYRFRYPNSYRKNLFLTKFEKDAGSVGSKTQSNRLGYTFIGAFPINIVSMPLSYGASDILKCTVSFSYVRYVRETNSVKEPLPSLLTPPNNVNNDDLPRETAAYNSDQFRNTNGPDSDFVERDPATGARMDRGSDGPLITARQSLGVDPIDPR